MSGIRPLERDDLPQVAALYEHVMRSGSRRPPPGLVPYLERTLFEDPWADPQIPSLVYVEDGRVIAFNAAYTRRMIFDGRPVRLVCSGQLFADPDARTHAAGALLMRKLLGGPQDATITDGATELVRQMWVRLGGVTLDLPSLRWVRVFRPWRYGGDELCRKLRVDAARPVVRALARLLDALTTRAGRGYLRPERPEVEAEPLTAEPAAAHLPGLGAGLRLRPDYDAGYLGWLFGELEQVKSRGKVVRMLVRSGDRTLGWYIYYLNSSISEVVQLVAGEGDLDPVVQHLFHHAHSHGAAAVQGRMEPRMVESLLLHNCVPAPLRWALFHSRDPELVGTATSRRALLTRLEGEWWMGHHVEPFS